MLVQARFFSCQPTLPSDPQSGSQSRPPMPLRMETRVYWWIRSERYHNFTRLPKCCPLGYPGDSPHTLSPHTQKRSSIKPSSLLPKEFVFASLWKRTSYSRIELAAHSGPVLFCAPSGSSPTVFAFSRCGAELHWFPSAEQQYSRIALGRTEQGIRLPSLTPGVSFISQPSQARSLCASRAVSVLKAYPCNHIRPY